MDHRQEKAVYKKKEKEREKAEDKQMEDEQDREIVRSGTPPRHVWLFAIGAAIVIVIVLSWTFLF